jgi:hypothetical protein
MAGEEIMAVMETGNLAPMLSGFGAGIWDVVFILLWVAIMGGGLWFVIYWTSFKHTIIIRELTSTRKFIARDKAKIKRNKADGVEYWYLRNRKVELVSPKPESIEITKKGRFYAECYHDLESGRDSGYSWIKDDAKGNFITYPAESKALVTSRIRRAAERRGKGLFEMIMTIAAISIPLIALIVVFSFWGDLTQQTVDASESLEVALKDFTAKVADYSTCSQRIAAETPTPVMNTDLPLDQQLGVTLP